MRRPLALAVGVAVFGAAALLADAAGERHSKLDDAPAGAQALRNPYQGRAEAVQAGRKLFERHCASCHDHHTPGRRPGPALDSLAVAGAPEGSLFWFLTNGDLRAGMPAWSRLPEARRWQLVTFLKSLRAGPAP